MFISQKIYTLDLLSETSILECKPTTTPTNPNQKLHDSNGVRLTNVSKYKRLVERLIYLSLTNPNISFVVSIVNQFRHAPTPVHMELVYRILKYLKGDPGKGLMFAKRDSLHVEAYTDADWAGSVLDKRSTFGNCTFMGGNLIIWRSKKQSFIVHSSAEESVNYLG